MKEEIKKLDIIKELEFILKEWIYKYKELSVEYTDIDLYINTKIPNYIEERIDQINILIKKLKETK